MAIAPLSAPPIPPNNDVFRALFIWVPASATDDPMGTDSDQNAVLKHCRANGVNVLFLDIWRYVCSGPFDSARQGRLRQFLDLAHRSGIKVLALAGSVGWALNQNWVGRHILQPLAAFNVMGRTASEQFDGLLFDVEYFADRTAGAASVHLPGCKRSTNPVLDVRSRAA
mgnify:CR=1 FL=1